MPKTKILLYRDADGTVPIIDWLNQLPKKAWAKSIVRLERLSAVGHELRRPEADFLRDGIYELRIGMRGQNYRILYFFHGPGEAVVTHGVVKERLIPAKEIDLAIKRKKAFEADPQQHTYEEGAGNE
jgi:phage-related protein